MPEKVESEEMSLADSSFEGAMSDRVFGLQLYLEEIFLTVTEQISDFTITGAA
jgi:hypothetical protein